MTGSSSPARCRACYAKGMTGFLSARQIRIFDYPRFAEPLRDRVHDRAIGDYPAATSHLERAVASYRVGEDWTFDPRLGADIGVTAVAAWGLALWHRGYPDRAHTATDEALRRARQLRHLHTLVYALLIIGLAAISARNTAEAEELANELVAISLAVEARAGACALSAGLRDVRSEHAVPGLAGCPPPPCNARCTWR
jgi:hypothetical protein